MLDYADLVARLEELPISRANRSIAQADFEAAQTSIDGIARALAWISAVVGRHTLYANHTTRRSVTLG
jgi:hypothetical protein